MSTIDQSGAEAGGDIVGGNKVVHNYAPHHAETVVQQLLRKLHSEMEQRAEIRHTVENLLFFYQRKSVDGVDGLEAKLQRADRTSELFLAFEKKEHFVKLLERWSMYASAQEIFAFLLAKIEHEFSISVHSKIDQLDKGAIDQILNTQIIIPTISECGSGLFTLNHSVVMGMIYWLAEQCFVRWHK